MVEFATEQRKRCHCLPAMACGTTNSTPPVRRIRLQRIALFVALAKIVGALGCGSNDPSAAPAGSAGSASPGLGGNSPANSGGSLGQGGVQTTSSAGGATGVVGGQSGFGGQAPSVGGNASTGGANAAGGLTATGGSALVGGATSTGGTSSSRGGSTTGGKASTGGAPAAGGIATIGGANAAGGLTATGGIPSTGGVSVAGGSAGASGGTSCPFPTTFKWKDNGGPIATPGNGWVSIKDFTNVVYNGQHFIYMTMHDNSAYGSALMAPFADWPAAAKATQTKMSTSTVAPTLFYFTPKSTWILAYQWCSAKFCYATSTDPTSATSWSFGKTLLTEDVVNSSTGPIDQTVICDSAKCYLFYAGDNGHIYRASMPIGNFPGTFSGSTSIMSDTQANLFEAVQVYTVSGTGKYLMIVEAMGSGGRYFRAFSASSLGGAFTAISGASTEASPFAGKNNVTFTGTAWTNDISHGDMVRSADETQTIDPCNMQLLYQGKDPSSTASYSMLPYRAGLLTKTN